MIHITPLAHCQRQRGSPRGGAPTFSGCSRNEWRQSEAVGDAVPNRLWRYAKERSDRHRCLHARYYSEDVCVESAMRQVTTGETTVAFAKREL